MSVRKYSADEYDSSDNDDRNTDDELNRAMRMSYGVRMSETQTRENVEQSMPGATKQNLRSECSLYNRSVEQSCRTVRSTTIILPLKDKRTKQSTQRNDRHPEETNQNTSYTTSQRPITDLKVKQFQRNITTNEITMTSVNTELNTNTYDNQTTNSNEGKTFLVSPNDCCDESEFHMSVSTSDKNTAFESSCSSNGLSRNLSETTEKSMMSKLNESNIWPALTALETTFQDETDANKSKGHGEIIDRLARQFNYSPREFTETLITIIEQSFMDFEESSEGLVHFMKKANTAAELLENESAPEFVSIPSVDQFTDVSSLNINSNAYENPCADSAKYRSLKRWASPAKLAGVFEKICEQHGNLVLDVKQKGRTIVDNRPREINVASPTSGEKKLARNPVFINNRRTPKTSTIPRIELERAFNAETDAKKKTPRIVVSPGTPEAQTRDRNQFELQADDPDDDEYLTADSDLGDAGESAVAIGGPAASSSEKLDMSSIALHHEGWVQAYNRVSNCKPGSKKHTSKPGERELKVSAHENKLEKRWHRELQRRRQKCFEAIGQALENWSKEKPESACTTVELDVEFSRTLQACSEYMAFATNTVSGEVKKTANMRSHSTINYGTKKSPRRSVVKKTNMKFRGPRYVSPWSKLTPKTSKRRSFKADASPAIDRASIRKVAELRTLFSPRSRLKNDGNFEAKRKKYTAKLDIPSTRSKTRVTTETARLNAQTRKLEMFGHVVSPVAQYIKGEK